MIVALALVVLVAGAAAGAVVGVAWESGSAPVDGVGFVGAVRGWIAVAAALATAVATGVLAWFARRLPEGVSGLLRRLDDAEGARRSAEDARKSAESERDAMVARLSRPYLHGRAVPVGAVDSYAEVRVGEPLIGGLVAPFLEIRLPRGAAAAGATPGQGETPRVVCRH